MDPEFKKRLLATYRIEAVEHLQVIGTSLLALEGQLDEAEQERLLKEVFREFHSLKGAARAVNETVAEGIAHRCEDLLSSVTSDRVPFSSDLLDRLREAFAFLNTWHESPPDEGPPVGEEEIARVMDLLGGGPQETWEAPQRNPEPPPAKPKQAPGKAAPPAEKAAAPTSRAPGGGTVRTPVERLDAILYRAEEMLEIRENAGRSVEEMRRLRDRLADWRKEWGKMHADTSFLRFILSEASAGEKDPVLRDAVHRVHGFLDWNRDFFDSIRKQLREMVRDGFSRQGAFELSVDRLLDQTKEVLMVPFSYELEGLAIFVSESARQSSAPKKARLQIEGGEVEVDRRILEAMKDPFIHLLRNAIDHSIEEASAREKAGKPEEGTIRFSVAPLGDGTVEIVVADDGRGIALGDLRKRAVAAGLIEEREAATHPVSRLLEFIFEPEFSTRTIVSESSGRGIGLTIVRERVERLGGHVTVTSREGEGAAFRIVLPLSLARFRAVEVACGKDRFLLPTTKVGSAGRVSRSDIRPVKGQDTIEYNSSALPLFHLGRLLGTSAPREGDFVKFITVDSPRSTFALAVDEIWDEREVVMKSLGPQLRRVRNIAGASIGASGEIIPVINLADIAYSVTTGRIREAPPKPRQEPPAVSRAPKVLVVEDSITARSLLKNILEGSGYRVITARDGVEGLAAARTETFDLVLTDVEMPRMNGIELTRQLRSEEGLEEVPVIILTALASREDKERGMEAGADAYVVKSSFDQSDLLQTMKELLRHD